jgi:trehalose utilization protein
MGFVPLHSSHESKPFSALMGTDCALRWRESGETERVWIVEPGHPIADGLDEYFEVPETEMYGERFDVPAPDTLVTISWFEGGEVFRSGCCYRRGAGRIFYFRPGHETFPVYYQSEVQRVLRNAVEWAAPADAPSSRTGSENVDEPVE